MVGDVVCPTSRVAAHLAHPVHGITVWPIIYDLTQYPAVPAEISVQRKLAGEVMLMQRSQMAKPEAPSIRQLESDLSFSFAVLVCAALRGRVMGS